MCVFVYVELSTVLTRGIEQASTETKARGEHEVTYHTDTTAAPKRLLSAASWLLHVGDNIH